MPAAVARHLKTDHHVLEVKPDALEVLPKLAYHYDEPFADSSAIPTWYVSELTRRHVTVALSGDGGDELFAGYPRYRAACAGRRASTASVIRCDRWLLATLAMAALLGPAKIAAPPHQAVQRSDHIAARRSGISTGFRIFQERHARRALSRRFPRPAHERPGDVFALPPGAAAGGRDAVTCASLTDLMTYLPCDLMTKVDIASMAHGLECRAPLLDYRVVEFAAALPVKLQIPLRPRQMAAPRRPSATCCRAKFSRRRKMGFGVPLDYWFRSELKPLASRFLAVAIVSRCHAFFRPEAIQALWDDHQAAALRP